jgi:long-chain acyl-CoA synthetase
MQDLLGGRQMNYRGMNWGSILKRNAEKKNNKLALICEDRKFTYGELYSMVNQAGNMLMKLGVKKGDRVCIYLPNCWQHIVSHFAVLRVSAVVVPLNVMYKSREIQYNIKDAGAETIITTLGLNEYVQTIKKDTSLKNIILIDGNDGPEIPFNNYSTESKVLEQEPRIDEREDMALIQYTSGTTGTPKGAMLTYYNVFSTIRTQADLCHCDDTDTQLIVLPLFHSFGIFAVYGAIFSGGLVVLSGRFDGERILSLIDQYKVSMFFCVPPMLIGLLFVTKPERYNLSSLRFLICGAAVLPVEVMNHAKKFFGLEVFDAYGCTEAYGFIMPPYEGINKYGSIGLPSPLQEVRLVDDNDEDVPIGDVGEIITKGPIIMKGYWNKPQETAESMKGGWYHTGDLARKDEDGYFYIVGRKKELIISSGFNIYPKEIEDVLYQHPKIADAAVIGVKHEYKGEAVKACIVLREGMTATPEEIIEYCRKTLAVFKAPAIVEIRKDLPRTAAGKVLKRLLVEENG